MCLLDAAKEAGREKLTELNITSPTGVRHASQLDGPNVAAPILDCFERMARAVRS